MRAGGAYSVDRAAALSGVPRSTVHYWATKDVLVPSASAIRVRLWSYADLLGLRVIYWLRQPKQSAGKDVPRTTMRAVRHALKTLRRLDLEFFEEDRPTIQVDRRGEIYITKLGEAPFHAPSSQTASAELINLIAPFSSTEGAKGPDLVKPRKLVRIVPRKLSGAPHLVHTRVETEALHALEKRGFTPGRIARLYPDLERPAIEDALGLERQLAANLSLVA